MIEQFVGSWSELSATGQFWVEWIMRSSALVLLAGIVQLCCRRISAAARHFLWMASIIGLLLLPALMAGIPRWGVLPGLSSIESFEAPADEAALVRRNGANGNGASVDRLKDGTVVQPNSREQLDPSRALNRLTPTTHISSLPESVAEGATSSGLSIPSLLLIIWLTGALAFSFRLLVSHWMLRRLTGRGESAPGDIAVVVSSAEKLLELKAPVRVLLLPENVMPLVWGIRQPTLLLPRVCQSWTTDQLRSVVLHELAHVRRRDLWSQGLVELGRCVYWFHPLYWLAARRCEMERERACDDLVLSAGVPPARFALHLVDLLAQLRPQRLKSALAAGMAGKRPVESRVLAILDSARVRSELNGTSRRLGIAAAAVLCLLTAAVTAKPRPSEPGSLNVADRQPAIESTQLAQGADVPSALDPEALQVQRIRELIYVLRYHRVFERYEQWAAVIRELVEIGPPAVPELIGELDSTDRDATLRGLAFTLRAIGDRRAVPALIRNIPKALRPPGSDCGMGVSDAALQQFMMSHDIHSVYLARHPEQQREPGDTFSYGRPVNEILYALEKLTGHREPDEEKDPLRGVFLRGTPEQQDQQRQQFADRQRAWQTWWDAHAVELIKAEEVASLGPPRDNAAAIEAAGIARFGVMFPVGLNVRLGPPSEVELGSLQHWNAKSSIDLDTGRVYEYGAGLSKSPNWPDRDWQQLAGVDVRSQGGLEGEDLHLWLIDNGRWETIEEEIQSGTPLKLGRESTDYLRPFRERSTDWINGEIGTFLFTTREGGRGILRAFPADAATSLRRFEYRMWERDRPAPIEFLPPDPPATATPLPDPITVKLAKPQRGAEFLYDLDRQQALTLPREGELEPFYSITQDEVALSWARLRGVDLCVSETSLGPYYVGADSPKSMLILNGIRMLNREIVPQTFETITLEQAREILQRVINRDETSYFSPSISGPKNEPATYVFQQIDGRIGVLQVTSPAGPAESITFRLRLGPGEVAR